MYNTKKGCLLTISLICFITAAGAQDVTLKLGNNDGTSKFTIFNSGSTERIRIADDGRLAIGTTETKWGFLVINTDPDNIIDGNKSYHHIALLNPNYSNSQISIISKHTDGNLEFYAYCGNDVNSSKAITFWRHGTTGGEVMRVNSDGNVGIGTTSPQGKLDVNGTIYQRGSQIHADYVFEPNYKIESIKEHADFMFKEKHLKAVPKAKKDEKGQDIVEYGSHMKGMLEELEKAHVYICQQEKRAEEQNKKIEEQNKLILVLSERLKAIETKVSK